MNVTSMAVQPGVVSNGSQTAKTAGKTVEVSPLFSKLLHQIDSELNSDTRDLEGELTPETSSLLDLLASLNIELSSLLENRDSLEEISAKITDSLSLESVTEALGDDELVQLLVEKLGIELESESATDVFTATMPIHLEGIMQLEQVDLVKVQNQLADLMVKFESLLSEVNNQQDIRRIAPKVLDILKQWSALENQLVRAFSSEGNQLEPVSYKMNQVLKEILQVYESRNKLTAKSAYQNDAQVTTKDVVKWIESALQNQQLMDKSAPVQGVNYQTNMAMPKLEQYVIFINQNQSTQTVDQQLVDQFQQVMKTSKFLTMPNGVNQLSIALRPENLGEMMIRLVEVNGEMTVKIVVTSQAAKDVLESNMNQLKHMFSPQQVVIERQDATIGQGQTQTKQSDEQSLQSQNQGSDESSHQEDNKQSDEEFDTYLEEFIQTEKG
ncbi:flagellar hook-length control protein FliK [Ornithinibacillus scapharcae]|uniref:flagellar hook-length control protein FliK n=1 Tax=Ornithinibacillus scapharcae TaxID=1147159 RepID=UPI000225AA3D|nr:flagellar hook-length control protein FliK [Ornithinibacillus scapharcae]